MSELFVNVRTSRMNLNELGGAFVRLLKASKELLSRRYRDGECDALALCRFSDEVGEVEQWVAEDYRNTDNHVFTFVIEKMFSDIRANVSLGEKFEISHVMSGWFKNGDQLLIRVTGRSLEASERYHEKNITIPRDLHELYKEAAEKWAEDATVDVFGLDEDEDTPPTRWRCNGCMRIEWRGTPVVHTADCKAARILGLKREGAE